MAGTDLIKTNGGPAVVQREEFGATQLTVVRETAATAVAAREKAAVEARYIVAMRNPRNLDLVRQRLLRACDDPDFAADSWFKKPAGKKQDANGRWIQNYAEGFSIRFAEEALRCFGNVYPDTMTVYEGDDIRMIRVAITDLETNITYGSEIILQKRVERKSVKEGQVVISERLNSEGKKVFLVEATDDEVKMRQNSERSKVIRTDGLRLIPQGIKAECKRRVFDTINGAIRKDPELEKRKIVDSFGEFSVMVTDLEAYLGHKIERVSPGELAELRQVYSAIKDGETSWDAIMADRVPQEEMTGSKEAAQRVMEEKLKDIKRENPTDGAPTADTTTATEPTQTDSPKGSTRGFNFGGKKQ